MSVLTDKPQLCFYTSVILSAILRHFKRLQTTPRLNPALYAFQYQSRVCCVVQLRPIRAFCLECHCHGNDMVCAEDISHIDTLQWNSVRLQLKLTASNRVSLYYSLSLSLSKYAVCRNKLHCRSFAKHKTENCKV